MRYEKMYERENYTVYFDNEKSESFCMMKKIYLNSKEIDSFGLDKIKEEEQIDIIIRIQIDGRLLKMKYLEAE